MQKRKWLFDFAINKLVQFANRISSICSGDLNKYSLKDCSTENIPAKEDGFDEDPSLESERTDDGFELEYASDESRKRSAKGSNSSFTDVVDTASVYVKEYDHVRLKRIIEVCSNKSMLTDAADSKKTENVFLVKKAYAL